MFLEATQEEFALPYGETGAATMIVLTSGTVHFDDQRAAGGLLSEDTLKEMAQRSAVRALIDRPQVAPPTPEDQTGAAETRLDAIMRARRSAGEDFGTQKF